MITVKELKKKLIKSGEWYNKILLQIGIFRIVGFKQNSLSNEFWVTMKFNYWNPLTYLYIIVMFITGFPIMLYDSGIKETLQIMKKELTEGFGGWIK